MSAENSTVGLLVIVIAIGMVALLAGGLAKYNATAGEQKRSQGWKIAAGALSVLLVGFFFFLLAGISHDVPRSATVAEVTPYRQAGPVSPPPAPGVRAAASSGVWHSSSATINGSSAEMHAETHGETGETHHAYFHQADAHGVAQVKLAWGPIAILMLVVGGIILVAASRRGTNAILAGLGIVLALLFLYALRSSTSLTARTPPPVVVDRVATPAPVSHPESAHFSPTRQVSPADAVPATSTEKSSSEAKSETDQPEAKTDEDAEHSAAKPPIAEKEPKPAAPRPAWVGSQPTMVGGVYRATAVSGPYSTERECEDKLRGPFQDAVRRYADRYLSSGARQYAWSHYSWVRGNVLDDQIVEDSYFEPVQVSFGPMLKLHVLLKIDQSDVAFFEQVAREAQVQDAVKIASASAACLLAALTVVYGGLVYAGRKKPAPPSEPAPSP